ncbi:hypothetical protein ABT052_48615 [Streptomyces sp. NPDC002766]|uniref:hypothetical protein n=1 Tax=Streptomyces sp. NPDC002766 TaxID=3154429 RepID=UPI00331BEEB3
MKKKVLAHAACVEGPERAGSLVLPAPAVTLVIVVVVLATTLVVFRLPLETVVTTVSVSGLLAVELLRRTIAVLSFRSQTE